MLPRPPRALALALLLASLFSPVSLFGQQPDPLGAQAPKPLPQLADQPAPGPQVREKSIFAEWAKALRGAEQASKKLPKANYKRQWLYQNSLNASIKAALARSGMTLGDLEEIAKEGVEKKWPTLLPGDAMLARRAIVELNQVQLRQDMLVFEMEKAEYLEANKPAFVSKTQSLTAFVNSIQSAGLTPPPTIPVCTCDAPLRDGRTCQRKVVGVNRKCFRHR